MKRGYISLFQSAYLAGQSAGLLHALEEQGIADDTGMPLEKMLYVAAFQGGIERFVTPLKHGTDHPLDRFLSVRAVPPKKADAELLAKTIALGRSAHVSDANDHKGWMGPSFVHDLIVAMKNNAAVVNVSGIPTVEEVRNALPPDVALPICTILSTMKRSDELLPAPAQTLDREMVNRFWELLDSDVFDNYSRAHERIEREGGKAALADVRRAGARLLQAGKDVLANRPVSMNVIKVVPKIVDAAFGKLPGTLAQSAGDAAAKFMDGKQNLVIYQFQDWAREYTKNVALHLVRKRTPKAT